MVLSQLFTKDKDKDKDRKVKHKAAKKDETGAETDEKSSWSPSESDPTIPRPPPTTTTATTRPDNDHHHRRSQVLRTTQVQTKSKSAARHSEPTSSSSSSHSSNSNSARDSASASTLPTTPTSPRKSPAKFSSARLLHRSSHSRSSSANSVIDNPAIKKKSAVSRDPDLHPLNLPPDELRRLSAMAAARDDSRSSMDLDKEATPAPATPPSTTTTTTTNGVVNGDHVEERSPTPPPHRNSPPAAATATADADSFKLAGNKFFKNGEYHRAIQEYNKGGYQ